MLFLLCLPPFIRTKRRFVGFSGETSFLSVTVAKFSLFPLASIESGLKKEQKNSVYSRRLENCGHHARASRKNLARYYEARASFLAIPRKSENAVSEIIIRVLP